jgi:hypothetical protein
MTTREQYQEAYRLHRVATRIYSATGLPSTPLVNNKVVKLPPVIVLAARKSYRSRDHFDMWDVEGIADQPAPVEVNRE